MDTIPARQKRDHRNKRKSSNKHESKNPKPQSSTEPATKALASNDTSTSQIKSPTEVLNISEDPYQQFTKRNVCSNWAKYENESNNDDIVETTLADFEQLLIAPTSNGGHFLFNSERNWEASDDWYNRDEYFNLNLLELEQSMATIPFYERQNYPKDMFSTEEIEVMEREAKFNQLKWMANNKKVEKVIETVVKPKVIQSDSAPTDQVVENDEDELEELLNLTGMNTNLVAQQNAEPLDTSLRQNQPVHVSLKSLTYQSSGDSKDDIQKWLDDVLDC